MSDTQQKKNQIDKEARLVREEADKAAALARQALADQESAEVREAAEAQVTQIQNDAQK